MNKPITVVYEDFKKEMADLINKSSLPPFIVETVLQSYLMETRTAARNQYQYEKAQYEKSLKEKEKEETIEEA